MEIKNQMFLLAAEEMNFSKAAERAFVTQQSLSANIRKLEAEYGVRLFERRPHLRLTEEGRYLYGALRKQEIFENGVHNRLRELHEGMRGHFTLGINATRAQVYLPLIYETYHKQFPHVEITVLADDMPGMTTLLRNGKIDLLVGIDCPASREFEYVRVGQDPFYFLARESLLHRYACTPGSVDQSLATGEIDFGRYRALPIVGHRTQSTTTALIQRFLDRNGIVQEKNVFVSEVSVQLSFCGLGLAGIYLQRSLLPLVHDYNAAHGEQDPIRIFRVSGLTEGQHIDLVTNRLAHQPCYLKAIMELFRERLKEYFNQGADGSSS